MAKKPPPPIVATAYGYARVSSRDSNESGLSEMNQRAKIADYYAAHLRDQGFAWGETVFDGAVSGKKDFLRRPMGAKLNRRLQRGDVVIVSKIDRAFRNLRDCLNLVDDWQKRGVRVVFVDMAGENFDVTTLAGKTVLFALGFVAEVEWIRASERHHERVAMLKASARPLTGAPPYGWRIGRSALLGKGGRRPKCLYPDPLRRLEVGPLIEWSDRGFSAKDIKLHLDKCGAIDPATGKPWHYYGGILRSIHGERLLRKLEAESEVPIDNRTTFVTADRVIVKFANLPPWIRKQLQAEFDIIDGKTGVDGKAHEVYYPQTSEPNKSIAGDTSDETAVRDTPENIPEPTGDGAVGEERGVQPG